MMVLRRVGAVAFAAVVVLGMGGCTQEECARAYRTPSEQRACLDGSNQMVDAIVRRHGSLPSRPEAERLCRAECLRRYNVDSVDPSAPGNEDQTLDLAGLEAACQDSCRGEIEKRRDAAEAWQRYMNTPGCEQVHIGGSVRCY